MKTIPPLPKNYTAREIALGQDVLDLSNAIVVVLGIQGEIQFFNKAAEKITGYNRRELLGKNWFDLIVPKENYNYVFEEFKRNIIDGLSESYENPIRTKNGEERYISWKDSPLKSGNKTNGVIAFGIDITDRKNLEEKLKLANKTLIETVYKKTEEYKNILDRITDGVASIDKNWNYNYINERGAELLNTNAAKLFGSNLWQYFPDAAKLPIGTSMKKAMEEQHYVYSENYYAPLDRWYENHFFPSELGMTNLFRDITKRKKTEQALHASDEKFRMLIENSNDAIIQLSETGIITYASPAAEKISGYADIEIVGKRINEFFHPEGSDFATLYFNQVIQNPGKVFNEYIRLHHKNGNYLWIEISVRNLLNNENVKSIIANFRDITEKKNAEIELKKREEKFRMLIENSHDGICLMNAHGYLTYMSPTAQKITGFTTEVVTGKSIFDFLANEKQLHGAQFLNKLLQFPGKTFSRINQLRKKNGELINIESNITNLLNDENVNAIITNFRDVTERLKAEEALEKSELNYRTLIEQAPDGVFISDKDDFILDVNDKGCKMVGYELNQLLNMKVADLISLENLKSNPINVTEYKEGKTVIIERNLVRSDGKEIIVEVSGKMLKDGRYQSFVRDISERKRIETELQESELNYKLLIEQAPDGVFITSNEHFIQDVNAKGCRMLGYDLSEFQTMKFYDLISKENLKNQPIKFTELKSGNTIVSERILVRKDGQEFPVEISAKVLSDGRYQSFIRDISERKKTKEELREKNEKLRTLTAYVQNAREEERKYIAREIHDELGQMLTGLKIDISWFGKKLDPTQKDLAVKIKEMILLTDETINSVRRIATELRPGILDDLGLEEAIIWQVNEFQNKTGIECNLSGKCDHKIFDPLLSITAFRILQESLTNIRRHAKATRVQIKMDDKLNNFSLEIADNGIGISLTEMKEKKSLGIMGMKERASIIGGMLSISSGQENGTTINIVIPIKG